MARLWAVRKNVTFVPQVLVRMTVNAQMDGGHTYAIVVAGGQERIALVHQEEFSALTEARNWNIAKIYLLFSFHGFSKHLPIISQAYPEHLLNIAPLSLEHFQAPNN